MKHFLTFFLLFPFFLFAQKKPLDHTVYDGWQSISERMISNNGKWVVYTVSPQEGDANLYIQSTENTLDKRQIPRGYNAVITQDSRYVVFKIKPLFKETRDARIKKKRAEEMPKDSIGIVELGKEGLVKVAKVRSYKTPEKAAGWVAFHKEKDQAMVRPASLPTQKTVDSLRAKVDSLTQLVVQLKSVKGGNRDGMDADDDPSASAAGTEGSDLVVRNLHSGEERTFKNISDYAFNKYGQKLVLRITKSAGDSNSRSAVAVFDLQRNTVDTILRGGNDVRNFAFTEDGSKLAFVAERDINSKALQRFYGLYLYRSGGDSAQLLLDRKSVGMQVGMTVSDHGQLSFSKSGNRLLFGIAPIQPAKDTTLIDFELAKLDIWHYKDDYLQSQQLFNLQNERKRSYQTAFDFGRNKIVPLGSAWLPNVLVSSEGDGERFVGTTDTGRRVQIQWTANSLRDVYDISPSTGERKLVKKNLDGTASASAGGKYILLYDNQTKHYFAWDGKSLKNISSKVPTSLSDEENDMPTYPDPYGIMGWHQGDSAVYVYDHYDVWKLDPIAKKAPEKITSGRANKMRFRYLRVNNEERFIRSGQTTYYRVFDAKTKNSGIIGLHNNQSLFVVAGLTNSLYNNFIKAKEANTVLYSKESFVTSPDIYFVDLSGSKLSDKLPLDKSFFSPRKLSSLNLQQSNYNWGTAEVYNWKTFHGKPATGILYKPEDFDPKKKYPVLIYFYEKLSDSIHKYIAPEPTRSRLNIPFFVSRGYLVFTPDISYTTGHPGKDAYNYIVSGAQALAKNSWVDAKNMGIQGQSWGGYQVAYLITATNMFKAAWAGAPVVNMFSAYGGIRWESGLNRQFQYEKTQSRIGATPWERPDLYIENSPFFHLKKVNTPLVIMANDADGAVPWYQGIEAFTALRRLGKPVWMLNYNGEAHNLVERRNRKDIQIREQQFFDWLLKGEKPARWITEGVPAVKKGRDWGLELKP